jgi:intein/homing endonuclease
MIGLPGKTKDALSKIIGNLFDSIALNFLGNIPKLRGKKIFTISSRPDFSLPHLFVQAMRNRAPNEIEADVLGGLLDSAHGYIESLKNKTASNITERIDGLAREASLREETLKESDVQAVLDEELGKAKTHIAAITEAESTKMRNIGSMMDITKVSAGLGDLDPTVFFIVIKDKNACQECVRLHLMPNGEPRLWKLSELKQGYHKRGEDTPSAFGLHPHCFVEETKLHTTYGLVSLKELFENQQDVEVFVDKRVKNRKVGNNQYGESVPGSVWFDRHSNGTNTFKATKVYDTGTQECIKITLDNGMSLSVSTGHEMWVDDDKNGTKIKAEEIKIGDKIPVISGQCGFGKDSFPELAELMGNLMGDGAIGEITAKWCFFGNDIPYGEKLYSLAKSYMGGHNYLDKMTIFGPNEKYIVDRTSFNSTALKGIFKNEFNLSKKPRRVPERIWKADKSTVSAFLRGLYAADGHSEKAPSVALAQNDLEFLKEIQLLLSNLGLISSICDHGEECIKTITYADGREFETKRKACWRLSLSGWDQCAIFAKEIGMGVPKKQEKLLNFLSETEGKTKHGSWRTSRVASVEKLGERQTYCLTEPMTNTVTANGIVTGQCRCSLVYLVSGFGFKGGKLHYISENFDAYKYQKLPPKR